MDMHIFFVILQGLHLHEDTDRNTLKIIQTSLTSL